MYLLAHLAAALLAGRLAQTLRPLSAVRLRWWALGGVLPDLIDKPLSLLVPGFEGHGRGAGHTLALAVLLLTLGWRHVAARGIALGVLTHLVLDAPWTFAAAFAWPLLGVAPEAGVAVDPGGYWAILLNPHVLLGEIAGALILAALALEAALRPQATATTVVVDAVVLPRGPSGEEGAGAPDDISSRLRAIRNTDRMQPTLRKRV